MKNRSRILMVILPVLACFALLPQVQATCLDGCNSGLFNVFQGDDALLFDSTGAGNSAFGWRALFANTFGSFNTGLGGGALVLNNGNDNTAAGAAALLLNTTGNDNTAVGTDAMVFNDSGNDDVAVGSFALFNNVSGADNTAVGFEAMEFNVLAFTNAALGTFAMQNNDSSGNGTGVFNTAVGGFALQANVDGTRNTAVGAGAIESGDGGNDNTAVGELAGVNITGNSNTCLGSNTGITLTTGEGNIYIGSQVQAAAADEFEFIRIGNDTAFTFPYDTFIAGIYGRPVGPAPLTVLCGSDGKLTANASSRRFKHDIKPMDKASEAILALKPVSFHYNEDATNLPWFGLIAEDVAQVSEALIVRDKEGKPFGVRYEEVNAMLLNEFLKEHKKVEEQHASISQLKSEMQTMVAQLKEQAAQIQKVSAQLEMSKPAAKVVVNKP